MRGFVLLALIFIYIPNVISDNRSIIDIVAQEFYKVLQASLKANTASYTYTENHVSPPELIEKANYKSETHKVLTEDGYVLTVYRIPGNSSNSTPVFLQHGLLESSADWLLPGRGKSLAYILWDKGYDVWLGNARGNTFSRGHMNLTTADEKFWNFRYDLPAVITHIKEYNDKKLFYIGHSMGATQFSVMAIERPDIAKNVKAMIGLAPATYVYHMAGFQKTYAPLWKGLQDLSNGIGKLLKTPELLPRSQLFNGFANSICKLELTQGFCKNLLFIIGGFNTDKFNDSLLPSIWSTFPAGTSRKLYTHFLQQINVNKFRRFDYGEDTNLKIYNSIEPPSYDLSKIQVPVAVFWSTNDFLVGPKDVQQFYNPIPLKLGSFKVADSKYSHFDFLWAKDAPKLVYDKVLDIMYKVKQESK